MKNETSRFSMFAQQTLVREAAPVERKNHPEVGLLLDHFAGELSSEVEARLAAHVATCRKCQRLRQELHETLAREEEKLESKSVLGAFAEQARSLQQVKPAWKQITEWLRTSLSSSFSRPAMAGALGATVACVVALAIGIPFITASNAATSRHMAALGEEIGRLRHQVDVLSFAGSSIASNMPNASADAAPEQLEVFVQDVQRIDDPWQRHLVVAAWFARNGLVLPAGLDWKTLQEYPVQPGDTWRSIADRALDHQELWPVVWLLNQDVSLPSARPEVGKSVKLPRFLD